MAFESAPDKSPAKLPEKKIGVLALTDAQMKLVHEQLPSMRASVEKVHEELHILEQNHPEVFERLQKKHPDFFVKLKGAQALVDGIHGLSDEEVEQQIVAYNASAKIINNFLTSFAHEEQERVERTAFAAARGELESGKLYDISPDEQRQMKQMAHDIWNELFPETYTDKYVRWVLDEKGELPAAAKIAAAPMNGIEGIARGVVGFFTPQTYVDMYHSVKTMSGMSAEDWGSLWKTAKFTYDNLSTTDKVAPVISFLTSLVFLTGSTAKIAEMAQKLGYSPRLIRAGLSLGGTASDLSKLDVMLPAATLVGVVLPYCKM